MEDKVISWEQKEQFLDAYSECLASHEYDIWRVIRHLRNFAQGLERIRIVTSGIEFVPVGLQIDIAAGPKAIVRLFEQGTMYTNHGLIMKTLHNLLLEDTDTCMYVQVNELPFNEYRACLQAVEEVNPYEIDYFLEQLIEGNRENLQKARINRALDLKDKALFYRILEEQKQ